MSIVYNGNGLEWFGKLSGDAVLSRVGINYTIILGKMLTSDPKDDRYTFEKYYCAANVHFDGIISEDLKQMWFNQKEKEQYLVNPGDLLIVEGGAGAGGCAVVSRVDEPIYIQNSIMIVRGKNGNSTVFLKYLIEYLVKGGYVDVVCNKATIPHFTKDKLSMTPFPLFSIIKQQRIAEFLDRKCAEIDSIIAKTKATIEEYKALKQAVITQAVTKGLRPDRPMKDSGVEWIGEICSMYEVYRLKHLLRSPLMYGANESGEPFDEMLPRYIRITDISMDGVLKETGKLSLNEEAANSYILEDNDLLFARSGASVGKAFIYKKTYGRSAFAGYLIKASVNGLILPDYLFLYTQSSIYEEWKKQIFIQSTIQNIGADRYNNLIVVRPSIDEQKEIIKFLIDKCAEIDSLIAAKEQLLTELESYKKSVIYEYVTGKKEV